MKRNHLALCVAICAAFALLFLATCDSVEREMLVSTGTATSITQTSAAVSGTIVDMGEGATQHGHCYGESSGVTVSGPKTTLGAPTGEGGFNSTLSGLKPGTTYYVKAYISDGKNTSYGKEISFTTLSVSLAQLTTSAATSVTTNSAISGGNITSDGGSGVTARGVCWSTGENPTISDNSTTDGTGTGSFVSNLTGLSPNTTYYIRAYATNGAGTAYGSQVSFTTQQPVTLPTVTTEPISGITTTTASGGGNVTSDGNSTVTARGICYSTSTNPTISDSRTTDGEGTGSFTSTLSSLTPNTTYYVRAYATNSAGTAYGTQRSFTTEAETTVPGSPTIGTATAGNAQATVTFTAPGSNGGSPITGYTVTSSPGGITGTGTSSPITVTGLTNGIAYTFTVTATNAIGTGPASAASNSVIPSTVPGAPTIGTATAGNAQATVTFTAPASNGGSPITGYTVTSSPGGITGTGTSTTIGVTGLTNGTAYTFTVTATNANGTGPASATSNSVTPTTTPTVTTTAISSIATTSASSGGTVTSSGGATVTARGVCWSTSQNPTTANSKTTDGSGTGSFTSSIAGLSPGTTYYVRAYATNSLGTGYGEQSQFTTTAVPPTLTTTAVTFVTHTSAISGGNISSDGGATVTARGVCWSTSTNPTITDNKTTDGSGDGSFESSITGLTPNTVYHVRAYATNSVGTSYGENRSFTTSFLQPGDVFSPATGKIWKSRNEGATRVATSISDADSYGHLFQWGRGADGHELRTSNTTTTLSGSDTPGHGDFILAPDSPNDWRTPQNTELWQGASGINNPCPGGYRLPTIAEWDAERLSWSSNDRDGAFNSPLKLPAAGGRNGGDGVIVLSGVSGRYWSSNISGTYSRILSFTDFNSGTGISYSRATGIPVRCIKN